MKNYGQTSENDMDSGILSTPLSVLRGGLYWWRDAGLVNRSGYGYYWSLRSYSTTYSNYLDLGGATLNPQGSSYRGIGIAVR